MQLELPHVTRLLPAGSSKPDEMIRHSVRQKSDISGLIFGQDGAVRRVQLQGSRGEHEAADTLVTGAHLRGGAAVPRPELHQRRAMAPAVDPTAVPRPVLRRRQAMAQALDPANSPQVPFSSLQIMYVAASQFHFMYHTTM
uniref:Uncharacterized protein n=1 Tax=Arundo donax TaxID=35708 RepID=A0A0A9HIS0_ARUDO